MEIKRNNYWAPTPVFFRKLGDAFLAVSTSTGVPAMMMDYKWTGITIFILGVLGKFLTNFFKDIPPVKNDTSK